MARARNIKPGFFTNDVLGEMPPLARLLFAGIWTICDRAGRVEDRPKKIRAEVLPYDNCDADDLLNQLQRGGFIARYTANGVAVIQVLAWEKHQNPHIKEAASTLPAPDEHGACTVHEECKTLSSPEQAGLIPSSLNPSSLIPGEEPRPARSARARPLPCPEGVAEQTWADWLALRKAKKAPVTETVLENARGEAAKAGMTLDAFPRVWCARGSQGLQADWLKPHERGSPSTEPAWKTRELDRTAAFAGPAAEKRAPKPIVLEAEDAAIRIG